MLEKNPKTDSTSYSFEQLLSWFGRFTPQFKFRLLSVRRQLDAVAFDHFVRETLTVFRSVLVELAKQPKGPERARRSFELIDEEHAQAPATGVSCAAGCSACCRSFAKQITDDEADLLVSLVKSGKVAIDLDALSEQAEKVASGQPEASGTACVFLSTEGRCRVYADRPGVCRKYYVTSPKENCADPKANVTPRIDLMPELIVSAAISLPDNGIDLMPVQLAKRLDL